MATAGRLAFPAWRNSICVRTIKVVGLDLTGAEIDLQVRLKPDTPGAALIDLTKQAAAGIEGLYLASVETVNGAPVSTLALTIDKTTIQALPYAGEVGDDTRLAYAMEIDGQIRLYGDFVVLASAFGSDSAPTDRPGGIGSASTASTWASATLTVASEDVITVTIDGADALGPLLATAEDAAARAENAADRALGKKADLFIIFGQSLTVGRAPQITLATSVVPSLFSFSGGSECENLTDPAPLSSTVLPVDPHNMTAMIPFMPRVGFEGWGPGLGYQSKLAGADGCFFFVPGRGSMSIKQLHFAHIINLQHALARAVKLLRLAGYEPTIYLVFDQGHADADALDDGNNAGTPTSHDDYLIAARKLFATMRYSATLALGYAFTGPIWVVPLLTQNLVASLDARRAISNAQADMPTSFNGVRLLPPRSQFANLFANDLAHPLGQGYRYFAEMVALYMRAGLTPPRMISKALSGGKITITFDQSIKIGAVPDAASPGNSMDGFTIIDNTGAEVAITASAIGASNSWQLTPANAANLTGTWYVRNGLQMLGTQGVAAASASFMPRTRIVGATDVGTAEDGTVLQNSSIVQEI